MPLAVLAFTMTATLGGCSSGSAAVPPDAAVKAPRTGTPAPPVFDDPGGEPCVYGVVGDEGCDAEVEAGSIVLPAPLYWATRDYIDRWAEYPGECGGAIGDCNEAWREMVRALAEVEAARLAERRLEESGGWEPWRERLYVILGITAGLLVGAGAGALILAVSQ